MKGLSTAMSKLKSWLRKKQPEKIRVRTYAGIFKLPADKPLASMGYDQLVQYAEATPNLRRIGVDQLPIFGSKAVKDEPTQTFHGQMTELSLAWARYVVGLRNRIK